MVTEPQASTVQWDSFIFSLDNEAFSKGFEGGRSSYLVDTDGEEPKRATKLSARELGRRIEVPNARSGDSRFDEQAIDYLEEYPGVFLEYMCGPLPVSMTM